MRQQQRSLEAALPCPALPTALPLLQGALCAQDVRTARLPGGQGGSGGAKSLADTRGSKWIQKVQVVWVV